MATVYVPGPSLTDAVEDNGPLPVESVLALAAGLAEALQAIHRADLVHRDLKPSNVLLAADGPRVIDFGISLALERSMMTATGMVMGSPGFMSPGAGQGTAGGRRADGHVQLWRRPGVRGDREPARSASARPRRCCTGW